MSRIPFPVPAGARAAGGQDRSRSLPPAGAPAVWPFRARFALLLAGIVLAVLLPALGFGGLAAWQAVEGRQAAAEARLLDTARALALALDREIDRYFGIARGLAAAEALDGPEPDLARFEAQARRVATTFGTTAVLLDAASLREVVDTALPPDRPAEALGVTDFRPAVETGRPIVTDLSASAEAGRPVVGVAVPVMRGDRIPFVLAVRLDPEIVRRLLAAQDLPAGSFAAVTDGRGVVVARSDALHTKLLGRPIPEENRRRLAASPSGTYRAVALDGTEQVFGFHRLSTAPGWAVVAAQPAATFDAAWRGPALVLGAGALLALALGGTLAVAAARGVLVPIRQLEAYARGLARSSGPSPDRSAAAIPPARVAELEALRQGFVAAETTLAEREATLAEGNERLRLALEAADLGTWRREVAEGTDDLIWDARCKALFGLPPDDAVDYAAWTAALLEEDRAGTEAAVARALDPGEPEDGLAIDYRVRRPDGEVRCLAVNGRAFFASDPAAPAGRRPIRILGTIRDVTEAREAAAALARSNEEARAAAERVQLALAAGAILGTWDWDLPSDRFTVDDRFAESFGIDPVLGRSGLSLEQVIATVHPNDLAGLHAAIADVLARGGPYSHEYRVRGRDGVYRWIEANGRVDRAPDGTPLRFPGVLLDVGVRRALEAERDQAAAQLRAVVAAVPGVVYAKDREGRLLVANEGTAALVAKPLEAILGRTDAEFLDDPDQAAVVMANDRRIMEGGTAEQLEEAVSLPDGSPAVWLSTKAPFHDASGRVVGLIGSSVDITARKQAEERLRESEARLRLAGEASGVGFFSCDLTTGATYWTETMYRLYGLDPLMPPPSMDLEGTHLDLVHPADRAALRAGRAARTADSSAEDFAFEFRIRRADTGETRWVASRGEFVRDLAGRVVAVRGAQQDVTERRASEHRLRLMINELNHRVKNTLATVQSIAAQTLRGTDPTIRRALDARLHALAAAHDVLTRESWAGADLDEVVAGVLAPHGGRDGTRFRVSGPPLRLMPRAAVTLSMALHELTTNALKYGALSVPAGQVEIRWEVAPGPAPRFRLTWAERGGPPVAAPARQGFGTRLVERGLAQDLGGTARIDFAPDGIVCSVEAALPGVAAPAEMVPLPRVGRMGED